ncbi:MAG: LPS export ABC transporter ATP-binding protein [Gammaproteobacteria bacterium]|nr:LPS export ABC transporter ATP-binding protein [Gammaproteobacteria bacterium]OYY23696.1 MAG: LPS export ABC transporter ATP-binding protein [Thiotrichales bacterium 35-46-9]OYZ09678.1 MAG: LPS export ABC transporter ATP-binding protein [Thiotrichales bacterium 16-46-22]OZA20705.1 MAG: LPS export ABC transporter ATP-binding protein [Thiotrichales bacterium 17-46-47]OZA98183.1 MAG: LPS export ABC transporter ATP-binding protein [Thiotrichales bacterium 34-46-19]OZB87379.1 MAG: LPS export ABC
MSDSVNHHRFSAHQLAKRYKKRSVVEDVSFSVSSGEVIGLLGPNGAGKTTTFYMMTGLVKSDAGRILLDDKDITLMPMHQRAKLGIGYLPQEASIFRRLSVSDNIMAILEMQPELDSAQRQDRLETLLEALAITHIRDSLGQALSGGERRRVEIARALAINPHFLLLDEPFAGVDPIAVADIQSIIRQLQHSGIGILITDHNVRETLAVVDRAYILSQGHILAQGTPNELLTNPKVIAAYLGENYGSGLGSE